MRAIPSPPPARRSLLRSCLEPLEARIALAAGGLDFFFGASGSTTFGFTGTNDETAVDVVEQADGKLVIVGAAETAIGNFDFAIARLNRDGSPDTTFNTDGKQTVAFNLGGSNEDRATSVVIQPDGKIVVAGFAQTAAAGRNFAVIRLNADGSPDTGFDTDGKQSWDYSSANDTAFDVALDGTRIVVGGTARVSVDDEFAAARLTSAGVLDSTFDGDGKQTVSFDLAGTLHDVCEAIAMDSAGRLILAGSVASDATGEVEFAATALTQTGALDTTFGFSPPGKVHVEVSSAPDAIHHLTDFAIQPNGNLLLAGSVTSATGTDFALVSLNATGSAFDPIFGGTGRRVVGFDALGFRGSDEANAVVVQPDGKFILAGTTENLSGDLRMGIIRLFPDGTLDPSFSTDGFAIFQSPGSSNARPDFGFGLALTRTGIVVVGEAETASNGADFFALQLVRDARLVVSADKGGPPEVRVFTPTGTLLHQFEAFDPAFTGGVRVTMADVNADGAPDVICAPGKGPNPPGVVRIFDGVTYELVQEIPVFTAAYKGGMNVAVGDVRADAGLELVVAPDRGKPNAIQIHSLATGDPLGTIPLKGSAFSKGAQVTVAAVVPGGFNEIVIAPNRGTSGKVAVLDGTTGAVASQFKVGAPTAKGGLFLAAGNFLNNNGTSDLAIGRGSGSLPVVTIFEDSSGAVTDDHLAFNAGFPGGVRIAAADLTGNSFDEIAVARGPGSIPEVRVTDPRTGERLQSFLAFDADFDKGLYVAASPR